MKLNLKLTTAAIALLVATACASQQKTEEVAVETPAPATETVQETITNGAPTTGVTSGTTGAVSSGVRTGPAAGSLEDFRVNVGERVYFDLNGYRLDVEDQGVLKRQAAWLGSYPNVRIIVAGNCDERGTREYNLALGERRASIVKDYLVGLGVDPSRIDTISYGKERPIADGSTDEAWALNRNGFTQIVSGTTS